jgi:hypothetical protein
MAPSAEKTLSPVCATCGGQTGRGTARCKACGAIRAEFAAHSAVVAERRGCCTVSGAVTDVRLPNGDYLGAPYFLECLAAGWIDGGYSHTEQCPWARRRAEQARKGTFSKTRLEPVASADRPRE